MKQYKSFTILALFIGFSINLLNAQEQNTLPVHLDLGLSYAIAPNMEISNTSTSGNFYNLIGDMSINNTIIGRVQYSQLIQSSIGEEVQNAIEGGWAINGSLGYIINASDKIDVPIMGTMGYAAYKRNSSFSYAGAQFGLTVTPKYKLSENFLANLTLRFLQGSNLDGGYKLGQTDFAIGILYRIM